MHVDLTVERPQPTLSDGRVLLRPWSEADGPALVALCDDPEIRRWTRVPDPYPLALAAARARYAEERRAAGAALLYAVCDATSDRLLGALDLGFAPADAGIAEVAYMLGAAARGRGVMTAAVRLLCAHAFARLGVRRVELLHHPGNVASAAVAERCGFTREGVLRAYRVRAHGREDRVIHALLDTDLAAGPAAAPPAAAR